MVIFLDPTGFKSEGEILSPFAIPCAPAHGSGDGGIGSLFALNPEVKDGGVRAKVNAYHSLLSHVFLQIDRAIGGRC